MRKLDAVSFVTLVILRLRRFVVLETMIVSVEEAGEFDMIQRISEKKNREKKKSRSGGQESFEKLGIYGS